MDINALLSPTDSGSRESSVSTTASPRAVRGGARPAGGKRTTSGLSNQVSQQPQPFPSRPSSSAPFASPPSLVAGTGAAAAPTFRPLQPPPTSNPGSAAARGSPLADGHAQQRPDIAHRPSSTPDVNLLASAAQSHARHAPTSRASSAADIHQHLRHTPQRSPSYTRPASASKPVLFRNASGKSSTDLIMAEAPAQTPPPRDFESSALTDTESSTVTDLLSHLSQKSYDYDSHVQLVNLLHKGFLAHVYPPADGDEQHSRDPRSYALLAELRQAREAMDTRFAIGEDLWADWLSDEVLLAANSEERISVTELCGKAVQDEPASVKLWQLYADWVQTNHASCNNLEGADQSKWTEEDKEMCKELFTRDMLINVLEQGIQGTQWRIDQSHLLWNRYAELVLQDLPEKPTAQDVERLRNLFIQRLQVPQAAWSDTAQVLYQTMSRVDPNNWEVLMDQVSELSEPAKTQMGLREPHELDLQRAVDSGDKDVVYNELVKYLAWEKKQTKLKRRATFEPDLLCMLYERALLVFPTYVEWWLDYIDFVTTSSTSTAALPLIERATRHCPWSGDLWARRILQSDVEGKSREDIEATKHRATNSGLLDVGGMEELLKVLQQWCTYLRRHAFSTANAEDEIDTAEFGISSALQDIDDAGRKIYGKDFEGDPLYRLEQIQIKFLSEARRFDEAREVYRSLVPKQKNSHDFWARYYNWELWLWGYDRIIEPQRIETADNGPKKPSMILREALCQRNLDWPERVLDLFLTHFQQHESGLELRQALSEAREFSKQLAIRRAKEAEDAAAAAAAQQHVHEPTDVPMADGAEASGKRKREEDSMPNGHSDKKTRTDTGTAPTTDFGEPSGSASAQIKRDRENNTITIKNLPAEIQELDVRKFFREVGDPVSITIIPETSDATATATVEFSTNEDVLAAKTRNGKDLLGQPVHILSGSQSTLYVTNYPAEYDEAAMRGLFNGYGEIISVRFPSLKFNNRRRFCYIQFLTSEMARAAEAALDGKMLDGSHKLLAKISDPDAKKSREGAQAEGRELFVKNLDREAPESEVRDFFAQYGAVVSLNMVKLVSGKKTGTAFVVLSSAAEATKALDAHNKPFRDRVLHVEIASAKGRAAPLDRARREDMVVKHSTSPEPNETPNGARGDSNASGHHPTEGDESWRTARERKVAVFNLPDTVTDARVRAAMAAHGALVKIQMRRQDGGAIVEFASVRDAFHVRQGVDCGALGEGVRTGDVGELLARVKRRQGGEGAGAGAGAGGGMLRPAAVSRPGGAGRGRGRGGLGFKRGGLGGAGARSASAAEGGEDGVQGKQRSNADFKALFEKSREGGSGA